MRIIAGQYRGRTLAAFRGDDVRPTSDRVKESLFQILSRRLVGARVLDLFCGSGALGLESLSRGAAEVLFNDVSPASISLLKKNLAALKVTAKATTLDFRTCLGSAEGKFDLIFCDPPYKEDYKAEIMRLVAARGLLAKGGLIVYESEREEGEEEGFSLFDARSYGRTKVFMFARREQ